MFYTINYIYLNTFRGTGFATAAFRRPRPRADRYWRRHKSKYHQHLNLGRIENLEDFYNGIMEISGTLDNEIHFAETTKNCPLSAYFYKDHEGSFLMIYDHKFLQRMSTTTQILFDATFKTVPHRAGRQMITIMFDSYNQVTFLLPLILQTSLFPILIPILNTRCRLFIRFLNGHH